jgi:hypothetical protein
MRLRIVQHLQSKDRLSQCEKRWLVRLQAVNKVELDFLKAPVAHRIENDRPCFWAALALA